MVRSLLQGAHRSDKLGIFVGLSVRKVGIHQICSISPLPGPQMRTKAFALCWCIGSLFWRPLTFLVLSNIIQSLARFRLVEVVRVTSRYHSWHSLIWTRPTHHLWLQEDCTQRLACPRGGPWTIVQEYLSFHPYLRKLCSRLVWAPVNFRVCYLLQCYF